MCGISVIIDPKNKTIQDRVIKGMNNLIRHRGPDGEGFYFGDHFALGHRMLKITDFGASGRQPMEYMHYVIIYNGEIYNFKELRETLRQSGYSFNTQSDTEVIMAAYDKWGLACQDRFVGMWSFVLYDANKNNLFCSRDRFGIKPLFYAQVNNTLAMGSEIKQLNAIAGYTPKLHHQSAFNFLYRSKIESVDNSFFEGVKFLPGGHHLIYNLTTHSYNITRWYDINKSKNNKTDSFEEATAVFNQLFTESILLHGETKLPVGACLSGGLDSTSIVGVSKKVNNPLVTFSSCYTQHGYNEIEYINDAVMHYQFPGHKTYPNVHELIENDLLRKIVYHQDQPILSGSFFSEYKVFENAAANNIRIMLSGQGADEYLGGYGEFSLLSMYNKLQKSKLHGFAKSLKHTASANKQTLKDALKSFIVMGLAIPFFKKRIESNTAAFANNCLDEDWIRDNHIFSLEGLDITSYNSISGLSKDALINYSLPHQLLSEDRNSMMNSIESRLPFLDHRLVEYCLNLPDNFIIKNGVTKAVLRESLKENLPASIYNRHTKLGFPGPEESMFTHNFDLISREFRDAIGQLPDIFSSNLAEMHIAYHTNKIPYNNFLFRALSFTAWARQFGFMEPSPKSTRIVKTA